MSAQALGDFWRELQFRLFSVLDANVPAGSAIAYADYPVYANVGDLLIYLGTEQWFHARGHRVLYRWSAGARWPRRLPPEAVIVCQGGGNFGDLYPRHQAFRERVVESFRDNQILCLPQTVHFRSPEALAKSATVFRKHERLSVMVRDSESVDLLSRLLPNVRIDLAPDMAVMLHPIINTLGLSQREWRPMGTLCLLRADGEQSSERISASLADGCRWRGDWRDVLGASYWSLRLSAVGVDAMSRVYVGEFIADAWKRIARSASVRSAETFLGFERIVTSRLHGHILAALVGVPSLLIDNSYGKNSAYFLEWHRPLREAGYGSLYAG